MGQEIDIIEEGPWMSGLRDEMTYFVNNQVFEESLSLKASEKRNDVATTISKNI